MNTATAPVESDLEQRSARPFAKWAGGKRQLLSELLERAPRKFNRYFEPMVGGGALFFALQPKQAILADTNQLLITTYAVIRDNVQTLIEDLKTHQHSEDYFYSLRAADQAADYSSWTDVKRASRFIYLNKTCFNGLYRVNAKGYFNVPFGDYKNPMIVDTENLHACSLALQNVTLHCKDFREMAKEVSEQDFVYIDPPYLPLNKTSSFTAYSAGGFPLEFQIELADVFKQLDKKGALVMLSNSFTDFVLGSYKGFNISRVCAARSINSNAGKRGKISEVIVTNF